MRKTYITRMPDEAGAFLIASKHISECGGNIVRVNYNKAIDTHTLFIEVAADEDQHARITERLREVGYLADGVDVGQILMVVLKIPNEPGAITPVLDLLNRYHVNIPYISSQENGTPYQDFKMGLLIEDTTEVTRLIEDISRLCEVKILDYEVTDRLLDGAVFYVTFANEMRSILELDQDRTNDVLVYANEIVQDVDDEDKPTLQAFDYIRRSAEFVRSHENDAFKPRIGREQLADDLVLHTIEPPCGSDVFVLEHGDELLFVDGGFACYADEMLDLLVSLIDGFERKSKIALITHADVDHVGMSDMFERIYMSGNCYKNFALEHAGKPNFREQNSRHAPYCALSKIIARYVPPDLDRCEVVGWRTGEDPLCHIGTIDFAGRTFDIYEGDGGHVPGETVISCTELGIVFTGDIYVNIKGFSADQHEFNVLAPFLMTSVDLVPEKARRSRDLLVQKYSGYLFLPGHGAPVRMP